MTAFIIFPKRMKGVLEAHTVGSEELSRESMIRLLTEIADSEIEKPEREMDCDLIKECSSLAERLRGVREDDAAAVEEIKAGVSRIIGMSREKAMTEKLRRRRRLTRIAAAACAAVAVSLPFSIRAAMRAPASELLSEFGIVCDVIGEAESGDDGSVMVGGTKIARLWAGSVYRSISELLGKEKLHILHPVPSKLPEGTAVTSASSYEIELSGGKSADMVVFGFTEPSLGLTVCGIDLSELMDRQGCEAADIDGTTYYFRQGEDGVWQAFGARDGVCCSAVCEDRELLAGLLKSLDMS